MDKKSQEFLLALPQVIGVGQGFKEVGGIKTGQEAIMILVKKKLPAAQLLKQQLIPKMIKGVVTDVIEVGEMEAYSGVNPAVTLQSTTSRVRPAAPGVSIGHYRTTAGTFGAVVYDKSSGQALILSNNHILANSSNGRDLRAKIGDPILQPGSIDGGLTSQNILARLKKYVALKEYPNKNTVDCALAHPLSNDLIVSEVIGIGKILGVVSPQLGMEVKKSGRTTGLTTGQIRAVKVTLNVNYGRGRTLRFENQVLTSNMSAGGDSGSLVVDNANNAVGLLFAGSNQGTLINPIQKVLDLLNVKF